MDQNANHTSKVSTVQENIDKLENAQVAFQLDLNPLIIAKGADMEGKKIILSGKNSIVQNFEFQLKEAIVARDLAEGNGILSYNLGVDKANEVYPHDTVKLLGLKLILSKISEKALLPEKITGCSVVQGSHTGKGNMHFKHAADVKSYMIMETQDGANLLDESKYYPSNPVSFDNSRGGEVSPKDPTKPTWFRIYGKNATGSGEWSAPFGGFAFH